MHVQGLVKSFGRSRALDGLDLEVAAGEVHGFLGPNGAGKSTTLRCLLGLLRADAGNVQVLGLDPWRDTVPLHRRLAYVPGDVTLWPRLTGGETIDLLLRLRGVVPAPGRRAELLERFALDPTKRAGTYSKGNRQKVALVAAFAADVDLLLLDEPTSGLDPLMEHEFGVCLAEHAARGTAVLLSSHILAEVEHLAQRVTIVRDGRTVLSGSLEDLRGLRRTRVRARISGTSEGLAGLAGLGGLGGLAGVHDLVVGAPGADAGGAAPEVEVTLAVEPEALPGVLAALAAAGVHGIECGPPSLEQLFLDQYRVSS
ncbi:ABC transporter ATP-binding protein [Nocardioides sp. GY 10127]|nr:ABC transporter ATP-binding protein [Nocardioides sp. GY 10127]